MNGRFHRVGSTPLAHAAKRAGIVGLTKTGMDLEALIDQVVNGTTRERMGVRLVGRPDPDAVFGAMRTVFGPSGLRIDSELFEARLTEAVSRIAQVAARHGRIAFCTTRPAAMLNWYLWLSEFASQRGAIVVSSDLGGPFVSDGRAQRYVTWLGGVGIVTDKESLLATDDTTAPAELMFQIARPDLVVADGTFAGVAASEGEEVIAFGDCRSAALAYAETILKLFLVPMRINAAASDYACLEQVRVHARAIHEAV